MSSWQVSRARSGLGMMDMPLSLSRNFSLNVCGSAGGSCSSSGSALISAVSRGLCWLENDASLCCAEILHNHSTF